MSLRESIRLNALFPFLLFHLLSEPVTPGIKIPLPGVKQRMLYVGNLPAELATEDAIKNLFTPAMELLPGYEAEKGPAVVDVMLRPGQVLNSSMPRGL